MADWYALGELKPPFMVQAALDARRFGYDSPTLRQLAELTHEEVDAQARELFPAAMAEIGVEIRTPAAIRRERALGHARDLVNGTPSPDLAVLFIVSDLPDRQDFAALANEWKTFRSQWRERAQAAARALIEEFGEPPSE